jgi:hypothetical protein
MNLMAERLGPVRRLLAAGAAGLVFLLGLAAASPDLHARMHGHVTDHDDAGCVIALFGHGVSLATGTADLVVVPIEWQAPPIPVASELLLTAPRYLRQPERGPPGT